jgi:hypothetical protein
MALMPDMEILVPKFGRVSVQDVWNVRPRKTAQLLFQDTGVVGLHEDQTSCN